MLKVIRVHVNELAGLERIRARRQRLRTSSKWSSSTIAGLVHIGYVKERKVIEGDINAADYTLSWS